jgi:putative ABC transport system permease protein
MFGGVSQTAFVPYGADVSDAQALQYLQVDFGFVEAMEIDLVEGRAFDPARPADSSAVVLNRAAVDRFEWEAPIGQRIASCDSGCTYTVIGVVDDFHFESLRRQVEPLALVPTPPLGGNDRPESLYARLAPGQTRDALDQIQSAWTSIAGSGAPFQYSFLDQTYDALHRDVQQAGDLFSLFSVLAVVVACLGLFGLATYTVQRREKEIGIRKALGASETQVVGLLSREFVQLVGIAFVVASPVAYFAMQRWLEDFAYRTSLGIDLFLLAGGLAVGIALLTVSTQAFRAVRLDPATTLRDE